MQGPVYTVLQTKQGLDLQVLFEEYIHEQHTGV